MQNQLYTHILYYMSLTIDLKESLPALAEAIEGKPIHEALAYLAEQVGEGIAFSSSLGIEDQLITHFIFANSVPVRVFTLDTGRLFPETYTLLDATRKRYGKTVEVYFPKHEALEELLTEKGPFSFYQSVENRKQCCFIRKVEPLQRALKGVQVWVTGIRREQSDNRQDMALLEWDEKQQLIKYNPLLEWTFEEVTDYVKQHHIPYNALHDKGFVSIGCAPCTRAIEPGENFRAGRWWWEDASKKECGLHSQG
jgi:phosphoadenosine phosphosulfate reductase